MSKKVTLRKMGNSVGFTIPKELLGRLDLEEGSEVYLLSKNDALVVTPYDTEFEDWADKMNEARSKHRNFFRRVAVDEED